MPSNAITKDQAREIAASFRDLSNLLGDFRFEHWGDLSAADRRTLEDAEWTLLNFSSDFITTAVGIALQDLENDLAAINRATARAKKVLANMEAVRDALKLASGLIVLGGAIASKNPGAILSAASDLFNLTKGILAKRPARAGSR